MPTASLTVGLDEEQTGFVDGLVRSGRFATRLDVVRAGLQALQAHDAALDAWLRDEVVPIAAALMADPSQAIPIDDVFAEIDALHASRIGADGGGA